ncbi:MAG: FAD-dependent oxidoreductase [Lentisphaerae bacterium]|nr:FAD-dependent oxidoreductase [Lentisphaerota bacterium]
MRHIHHQVDFCVVGGGIAGMFAAIAAARRGAKVALIQDRPVLGGNASSEIRMWICGAHGLNNRETGLLEEINLENNYRNPGSNFSIWDSVLYQAVRFEPNIDLMLNCSVNDATMADGRIVSVKGWQTTTETWHVVTAKLFADCSGDSILAPLTNAKFRLGREAREEYNEDIEPPVADRKTMGMSCLLQARETDSPKSYTPPKWARKFPDDASLPNRGHGYTGTNNFWWIELGGENDSIHDSEELRDQLLAIAFGVWDHIKNHGDHGAANWELNWVGFLPGKRESRRYLGDHVLTQNDVRAEGRFADIVAYGGWSMDDHHPAGFNHPGAPTIFHPAPSPFGIPYRCLYSANVPNLFFAGRNISTTHAAMSSTRVMATCGLLGQAVGTAAAIATAKGCSPREVGQNYITQLQQALLDDDCFLPWQRRVVAELSTTAALKASVNDPEPLRNGLDRPSKNDQGAWDDNSWQGPAEAWVEYDFGCVVTVSQARMTFDSDLNRCGKGACAKQGEKNILSNFPLNQPPRETPPTLVKAFRLEAKGADGQWRCVHREDNNYQRLVRVPLAIQASAVRIVPEKTWGADTCKLFAFELS